MLLGIRLEQGTGDDAAMLLENGHHKDFRINGSSEKLEGRVSATVRNHGNG
jgi:hypothetical protein